VRRLLFV